MEHSDKILIEEYLKGDEQAFGQLLDIYLEAVYNFIFRMTNDRLQSEDLVQETFIKAWKNLKRYDYNKNFKTWLFTIAKNTVYDYFKKKKTIPFSVFLDDEGNNKLENISGGDILPDELLMQANAEKIFKEKLEALPEHYRIILILHYKEDFSLAEIAEILNLSYNTVKSQHRRGLVKLRKLLVE